MPEEPTPPITDFFNEEMAETYDDRFAALSPLKDALHLGLRMALSELPKQARVLCVGAGTGAEVLALAKAYPGWRFTLVEPSAAMLKVARRRCESAGLASQCSFHHGFLESLPASSEFDAATAVLVSQFLVNPEQRRNFFKEIAVRLVPEGLLVNADLSADRNLRERILQLWFQLIAFNGANSEQLAAYRSNFGKSVAVSHTDEVEALLTSAGFDKPIRFLQALLIQAWVSRRQSLG